MTFQDYPTISIDTISTLLDSEKDSARKTQLLNLYTTISLGKELTEEDIYVLNELNH